MEQHLHLFLMKYGYAGIFLALAMGVVGLPIPDELLMTYVGYAISQGVLKLPFALVSAFLGASAGITVSYFIGLKWGLPLLLKVGPYIHISHKKIELTQRLFAKYGPIVLLIGYFLPGVRHISAYLAGMSVMDFRRFAGFSYTGALLWTLTFLFLGHTLEEEWYKVVTYGRRYGLYLLLMAIVIGLGVYVYTRNRQNKIVS